MWNYFLRISSHRDPYSYNLIVKWNWLSANLPSEQSKKLEDI